MGTNGKAQRKEKEFRLRRAEILEHAEKIFAAKGFHETTMAEIADTSGFSIGSLYRFFSGKEALYSALMAERLLTMYAEIDKAVTLEHKVVDKIRALVISHFAYMEHHKDFYRLLVGLDSGLRSEGLKTLRQLILDEHRKHVDYINGLLQEGIRLNVLRALDAKSLANSLIGIISYFKFAWIMSPDGASLLKRVDDVLDVFLRGAANEGGRMAGAEEQMKSSGFQELG